MDKFTIIQDTREKIPWNFQETEVCNGALIEKLDTGDYSIEGLENLVAIERKRSTAEIAQNIHESRFKDVINRLESFKHSFIICEFTYQQVLDFPINSGIPLSKQKYIKTTAALIDSYLLSLITKRKINVIFAGDSDNGQHIAYMILKKIAELEYGI